MVLRVSAAVAAAVAVVGVAVVRLPVTRLVIPAAAATAAAVLAVSPTAARGSCHCIGRCLLRCHESCRRPCRRPRHPSSSPAAPSRSVGTLGCVGQQSVGGGEGWRVCVLPLHQQIGAAHVAAQLVAVVVVVPPAVAAASLSVSGCRCCSSSEVSGRHALHVGADGARAPQQRAVAAAAPRPSSASPSSCDLARRLHTGQ